MDKRQEVISELSDAFEASGHSGDTAKTVAAYLRSEEAIRQMTEYLHHSGQVSISEFVHEMVAIRDRVSYEDDDLYVEDGPLEKEISKEAIFQYYKSVSYGRRGDYYRDFGIRIYENKVFRLFVEICEILGEEGIRLSIHRCEFSANDSSLFSKIRSHIFRKKNK